MVYENLYAAIAEIADRAQAAPINWLRNHNFSLGDLSSGNQSNPPLAWEMTGTSSWTRYETSAAESVYNIVATIGANGSLNQTVDFNNTDLNAILASANALHAAATMRVSSGTAKIVIRGKSSGGGNVFTVTSKNISVSATPKTYGFIYFLSSDSTSVTKLQISIESTAGATVQVYGVSAGSGVTPSSCILDRNSKQYLSLDGGPASVMRGDIDMGDKDIINANNVDCDTLTVGGNSSNVTIDDSGNITADGQINAATLEIGGADPNFYVNADGSFNADGDGTVDGNLSAGTLEVGGSTTNVTIDDNGNISADGEVAGNTLEIGGGTSNFTVDVDGNAVCDGTLTVGSSGSPKQISTWATPTSDQHVVNKGYLDGRLATSPIYGSIYRKRADSGAALVQYDNGTISTVSMTTPYGSASTVDGTTITAGTTNAIIAFKVTEAASKLEFTFSVQRGEQVALSRIRSGTNSLIHDFTTASSSPESDGTTAFVVWVVTNHQANDIYVWTCTFDNFDEFAWVKVASIL
jgi:hypothetical protein